MDTRNWCLLHNLDKVQCVDHPNQHSRYCWKCHTSCPECESLSPSEWARKHLETFRTTHLQGYSNRHGAHYGNATLGNVSCAVITFKSGNDDCQIYLQADVSGNPTDKTKNRHFYNEETFKTLTTDSFADRRTPGSSQMVSYSENHERCSEQKTLNRLWTTWRKEISPCSGLSDITVKIFSENMPCKDCRAFRLARFKEVFSNMTILVYYQNARAADEAANWTTDTREEPWWVHKLAEGYDAGPPSHELGAPVGDGWKVFQDRNARNRGKNRNKIKNEKEREQACQQKKDQLRLTTARNNPSKNVKAAVRRYRETGQAPNPRLLPLTSEELTRYNLLKDDRDFDPDRK